MHLRYFRVTGINFWHSITIHDVSDNTISLTYGKALGLKNRWQCELAIGFWLMGDSRNLYCLEYMLFLCLVFSVYAVLYLVFLLFYVKALLCLRHAMFRYFMYSICVILSLGFVVSIVCLCRVCYSTFNRPRTSLRVYYA